MAIFYVDVSIGSGGSGTSGSPWGSPASITGTAAGDVVYFRRVTGAFAATIALANIPNNLTYARWPISTDPLYAGRPSNATWDADAAQSCTINLNFGGVSAAQSSDIWNFATGAATFTCVGIIINRTETPALTAAGRLFGATTTLSGALTLTDFQYNWVRLGGTTNLAFAISGMGSVQCVFTRVTMSITTNAYPTSCTWFGAAKTGSVCTDCAFSISGEKTTFGSQLFAFNNLRCSWLNLTVRQVASTPFSFLTIMTDATQSVVYSYVDCTFGTPASAQVSIVLGANGNSGYATAAFRRAKFYGFTAMTIYGGYDVHAVYYQQGLPTTTGLILSAGSNFVCEAPFFAPGNGSDVGFQLGGVSSPAGGEAVLRNVAYVGGVAVAGNARVAYQDQDGILGMQRDSNGDGVSWASPNGRTGGSAWSIGMIATNGYWLPYAGYETSRAGEETIQVVCPSGASTITVYGAYRNFSPIPTKNDIWFEAEYMSSGTVMTAVSSRDSGAGALLTDTSVWTGDGGLVAFKMTVSVNLFAASPVGIRVYVGIAQPQAVVFVDPVPVRS